MKIILGLGNPGKKYEKTRHNVGFLLLDELKKEHNFPEFQEKSKFKALISEGTIQNQKVLLVKPQTFMNLSGETIALLKSFYKIIPQDLLIIYDDKDMEFGKIRSRDTGSSGGHNGIKDIIRALGTEDFPRIKIGIADEKNPAFSDTSQFVLSKFSEDELSELYAHIFPKIINKITEIIQTN